MLRGEYIDLDNGFLYKHVSVFLYVFILQCGPGGCLIELAEQLFIIMVGKQLINNVQEFIIPYVSIWLTYLCGYSDRSNWYSSTVDQQLSALRVSDLLKLELA